MPRTSLVAQVTMNERIQLNSFCSAPTKAIVVSTATEIDMQPEDSTLLHLSAVHLSTEPSSMASEPLQSSAASVAVAEASSTVHLRRSNRSRHPPQTNVPAFHARPRKIKRRRRSKKVGQVPGKWKVAYIKDRVTTASGEIQYRVFWKSQKHGRLPRTWEPREMLLQDGFGDALKIVDDWVDAGRKQDFFQFVSELFPSVAGANPTGTCLFFALQHALQLAGEPFGVRDSHVQDFLARATELHQDLSRGVSWKIFRAFLLQLHVAGSRLSLDEIEFNRHRTGHRGVSAIVRLSLEDGVYLVAASNTLAVGHAFVLQVRGAQRTVFDDSSQRPLVDYGEWIDRVMFVRKVALLD